MSEDKINKLREIIENSKHIVFFGGAGVSTESGIPDFRSADGLYNDKGSQIPPEQIISHSFFVQYPEKFFEFYKSKMLYLDAKPNAAHRALAKLEDEGRLSAVVTQNIDGLHQLAGSRAVYELHGSVHRNYCMECGKFYDSKYVKESEGIPRCSCGGVVKPDVVLYEEGLDSETINKSVTLIRNADTLIVGGTSLIVYPAAGFIDYFRGRNLVAINKGDTGKSLNASLEIHDKIGETFAKLNL